LTEYLQEEKYAQIDGSRICYIDEGEGPAVLLVHGLGGSMCNWAPTIEHLKRANRVIAIDLPGFGKSECTGGDCSVESFVAAIRGLLAHLGVEKACIIGNSLGGLITLHITLNHPDMVESIVLVDSAGTHGFPELLKVGLRRLPPRWVKRMMLVFVSYLVRFKFSYRMAGIYNLNEYTRVLLQEAIDTAARSDLAEYLETYFRTTLAVVGNRYDERLAEITKPVLVVWGQNDIGLPIKIGQRINRLIKGSFLVAIPKAAHVPQLDQPEAFNAAVDRFLAGARAERSAC